MTEHPDDLPNNGDVDDEHSTAWWFGVGLLGGFAIFLLGYWTATIIYAVMQGPGIPLGPFLWVPAAAAITGFLVITEDRVQASRHWDRVEGAWYWLVLVAPSLPPIVLAVVAPFPVLTQLPPGASVVFAGALIVVPIALIIARGKWIRRRRGASDED